MSQTGLFDAANGFISLSAINVDSPHSMNLEVSPVNQPSPKGKKRRQSSANLQADGRGGGGTKDAARSLACLSCRQKKIKCYRKSSTCNQCERLEIPCIVPDEDERLRPSSKRRTRELERRIESLEKQLRESEARAERNLYLTPPSSVRSPNTAATLPAVNIDSALTNDSAQAASVIDFQKTPHTLIARLCAEKPHFRADESGLARYYGPTSSLHTSEKMPYNFLKWDDAGRLELEDQENISPVLRDHLLEQYWRFQHQVLQVVHREAFLQDMQAGRSRYYSKALLYAILVNAAVFSEVPEIRALALSRDEDAEGSKPYLLRKATELAEQEIENKVGLTTIQSLQLLSAVYSRRGQDTKGWLESGRSSRLIFELGLHKDDAEFQSTSSSPLDLEVRKVVFWGCFAYDRGWGLYLGRPCAINLGDVTISPLSPPVDKASPSSSDLAVLMAWATLFTIVGEISHALNQQSFTYCQLKTLREKLLQWESSLDPGLRHSPGCPPAVYVLQLQFHGAMILLHRSSARFGTNQAESTATSLESRAICLDHVLQIGHILADYRASHGSAMTLVGVAMYNITSAAVVLIALRAEQSSEATNECLSALTTCIAALEEIQCCHMSAKTVLKQLRYLMRRCKLLSTKEDSQALRDANASLLQRRPTNDTVVESPPVALLGQVMQQDWSSSDATSTMDPGQFMLALEDCEALMTMGSWNDFQDLFV
ncbi:hypothetical protein AYO21_09120 [Fonsecaea monophora]|uniref:Zn(2)-C6 fungal-type domain-containing protein n=1 Tax=Fonsecaea monophora TaxID=254056 RepID=A0A177EYS0_9EURO|nr:hypothetical protein AYO21_09120 [Fonsecaea monophora]KAH0837374.1 putative fungal specific transcription factor [Fonsecaea pedrosoi]OAG36736.1 hypothetical protein AYO21_09120 [Fonsecaea monophora]